MNGKDLLIGLGNIDHKYYDEAENDTIVSEIRHRALKRPLLVAAIIALTALLVGCGVVVAKRILNWTPEIQEILVPYNEETALGAGSKDWYIDDVDISLSIDQPETSVLPISAETWTAEAEGTLEVGTEYWIEKWNGAAYQEIPTLDGNPWLVPPQTLECNGEFSWTADYAKSYGQLEPGHYQYTMTEVWKAGLDYFQHWATYYLDDTFRWDGGDLLRNGIGHTLTFGSVEVDVHPETVENVQYLEPFNFTLHLSEFDFFKTGVDSVTTDGNTVILIKEEEYVNDVHFGDGRLKWNILKAEILQSSLLWMKNPITPLE